jgi:hypothetical protein
MSNNVITTIITTFEKTIFRELMETVRVSLINYDIKAGKRI